MRNGSAIPIADFGKVSDTRSQPILHINRRGVDPGPTRITAWTDRVSSSGSSP
jgi:hypothetical protein